jgi:WD40 repeat protein
MAQPWPAAASSIRRHLATVITSEGYPRSGIDQLDHGGVRVGVHGVSGGWYPLTGHTKWVSAVAAVPLQDGRLLLAAAGGLDKTVRLWDSLTGKDVRVLRTGSVSTVAVVSADVAG